MTVWVILGSLFTSLLPCVFCTLPEAWATSLGLSCSECDSYSWRDPRYLLFSSSTEGKMPWPRCSFTAALLQETRRLLQIQGCRIHLEVVTSSVATVACFGPQQSVVRNVRTLWYSWTLILAGTLGHCYADSNLNRCIAPTLLELSISEFVLTGCVTSHSTNAEVLRRHFANALVFYRWWSTQTGCWNLISYHFELYSRNACVNVPIPLISA